MLLKWHGTATIEIDGERGKLLFDPFVPIPESEIAVNIADYDGFTDILVTHGHFDHIVSIPKIVRRNPEVRVWCTDTPYETLANKGVPAINLQRIDYGQKAGICGFEVSMLHGRHAVLPKASIGLLAKIIFTRYIGNLPFIIRENRICQENDETVFYLIEAEGKRVAVMGSMNLRPDVEYPTGCDYLILPYNGWDDNYPHAVEIIEKLCPTHVYLDHYDAAFRPVTAPLDLTPILERYPEKVEKLEAGIEYIL